MIIIIDILGVCSYVQLELTFLTASGNKTFFNVVACEQCDTNDNVMSNHDGSVIVILYSLNFDMPSKLAEKRILPKIIRAGARLIN